MKKLRIVLVVCAALICGSSVLLADVADELIQIGERYRLLEKLELKEAIKQESIIKADEKALVEVAFSSIKELESITQKADEIPAEVWNRLITKIKFEVNHEKRIELKPILESWVKFNKNPSNVGPEKKTVIIYGNIVNLKDGQWQRNPDGRRFWISNEYSDIILSPAEYRRYMKQLATNN